MTPRFHSTRQDPRRISSLECHRRPLSEAQRRRIHGRLQPMAGDDSAAGVIVKALAVVAIALALILILAPGAAWLAHGAPSAPERAVSP